MVLCAVLAIACSGDDDAAVTPSNAAVSPPTIAIATATVEASVPDDKPTEGPTPASSQPSVANEPVSVEAPDGVVLQGHLYSPDGPKRQALIIVAPVDQSVWAESTQALTSEGIAVYTFDPRGYGETGGDEDTGAMASDTQLITHFVMSREYPLVYLMGIGMDGSAAVTQAAASLDELSGIITYGGAGKPDVARAISLGGDATWNGENVLAIPDIQSSVLTFVLGGN
jgi:hypothetical protein